MTPRYPIGIQNFETVRTGGFLYIDKTAHIYEMAKTQRYYLLLRPPLFGKSLLLSTIKAYFLGKKELFKGLEIEKLEKDWVEHPVLYVDLKGAQYDSVDSLIEVLNSHLVRWEEIYGKENPTATMVSLRFASVIESAYEKSGQLVVILIDNFDEPLLQTIHNRELQKKLHDVLASFYGQLKTMDGAIRFALLTGITKVGSNSIYSHWNPCLDISRSIPYFDICGISEREIHDDLEGDIQTLASANRLTYDEACAKLREYCGVYHFTKQTEDVYNPYSFLRTLESREFRNHWCEATKSFSYVAELLRDYNLEDLTEFERTGLPSTHIYHARSPIFLMYYCGFLTVKGFFDKGSNSLRQIHLLGFPNRHVEKEVFCYLLSLYAGVNSEEFLEEFVQEIERGEVEAIFKRLQRLFADATDELNRNSKLHLKNVLFVVCRVAGFYMTVDYRTSPGHVDLVMQTDRYVYITEIKVNESAEEALRQVEEKQYASPFTSDPRKVFLIGVSYSEEKRNFEKWLVKQLN